MPAPKLKQARTFEGHEDHVSSCSVAADGSTAVSGSWDNSVRCWDTSTGACTAVMEGHTKHVFSTAIAPGGEWVLSGGEDGTVRRWDAAKGECLATTAVTRHAPTEAEAQSLTTSFKMKKANDNQIYGTAVVGDGSSFVCGCADYSVKLFSVGEAADELQQSFLSHTSAVHAVSVFADGTRVLSGGGDRALCVFDLAQQKLGQKIEDAHGAAVACCAVVDENSVVSGGWDQTARLFDLRSGKEVLAMTASSAASCVTSCATLKGGAFAAFGCSVAEGSDDYGVSIWDLRKSTREFGHAAGLGISSLALAADGQTLVSGCSDQTLRSWKVTQGSSSVCTLM